MKACPWCAESIQDAAVVCRFCKQPLDGPPPPPAPPVERLEDNAGVRMLIPVGRSVLSLVAGYLGLFSLLLCPAPIALIVSIFAAVQLRKNPELRGWGRTIFGLVMGAAGTVVMVVLLVKGVLF